MVIRMKLSGQHSITPFDLRKGRISIQLQHREPLVFFR